MGVTMPSDPFVEPVGFREPPHAHEVGAYAYGRPSGAVSVARVVKVQLDKIDIVQSPTSGVSVLVIFMDVVFAEAVGVKEEEVDFLEVIIVEVNIAFIDEEVAFRDTVAVAFQPVDVLVLFPMVVGGVPSSPWSSSGPMSHASGEVQTEHVSFVAGSFMQTWPVKSPELSPRTRTCCVSWGSTC